MKSGYGGLRETGEKTDSGDDQKTWSFLYERVREKKRHFLSDVKSTQIHGRFRTVKTEYQNLSSTSSAGAVSPRCEERSGEG